MFTPREPEEPIVSSGTFLQPETPETVVDNIRTAVAELNPDNYARSLADDLVFEPASVAQSAYPWETWGKQDEISYFRALAGVPQPGATHSLVLTEETIDLGEDRSTYAANYQLVVHHRLTEIGDTVQGQLVWVLVRGDDRLWHLQHWTDSPQRDQGSSPTWSTLKAVFVQ